MKLGILVNSDKHLEEIKGLTKAAHQKGYEVTIFAMDDGTKLIENSSFAELCELEGVSMSYCDHSAEKIGVNTEGVSNDIKGGSQLNNAIMNQNSDKVIVL